MKKLYMHIVYLFLIIFAFSGCQSVKDGLTGKKNSSSDEFLVKKKNPLVLPPKFDELPEPKMLSDKEKNSEKEIDLKAILTKQTNTTSSRSTNSNSNQSLEKNILEKIKNN